MNPRFLLIVAFGLMACRHDPMVQVSAPRSQAEASGSRAADCHSLLAELDSLPGKELKNENERVQKILVDKKSEDFLRASMIAGVYQAKNKNYTRAIELLSPISNKKSLDEPCRASVRLYIELLSDLAQMEKDLLSERQKKTELERKLKALSEIEKEISQRDNKAIGL